MNSLFEMNMTQIEPEVGRTWRGGAKGKYKASSIITTIPASMTHQYHLEDPTNIIFIPTEKGILIKKLEVAK
jgi:hypothetical protein